MSIKITVTTTKGLNADGLLNHGRHAHLVPHGSTHFDLNDSAHDILLQATGSGFRYEHGFPVSGAVKEFTVTQNHVHVLDVEFSPALKTSVLTNPNSFENYFQNTPYIFVGNNGNDSIKTGWGPDHLNGGKGNDHLGGNIGNDIVLGGLGNDTLEGGRGNDVLIGGLGKDSLSGGKNTDKFVFKTLAESVVGANHDVIINFHHDQHDRIDLSSIDADRSLAGNQAFHFIGTGDFSDAAGELRYAGGKLQADVNGDGVADFEVALLNVTSLAHGDFIL
jgi:serralysin